LKNKSKTASFFGAVFLFYSGMYFIKEKVVLSIKTSGIKNPQQRRNICCDIA
jgi:hypothetical protein